MACMGKKQPWFYWSCSSMVIKDASPVTLPSAGAGLYFKKYKQHNPWIQWSRKNITTQWCSTERQLTATTQALYISCNLNYFEKKRVISKHCQIAIYKLLRQGFRETNHLITDIYKVIKKFEKHCGLLNTDTWTTVWWFQIVDSY